MKNIESMEKLISALSMLPGVGKKTAERYAYSIINMKKEDVEYPRKYGDYVVHVHKEKIPDSIEVKRMI